VRWLLTGRTPFLVHDLRRRVREGVERRLAER
jgi:hypothetical protein